jgi:hypothetical protein
MKTNKKLDLAIELIKVINTRGKYIRIVDKADELSCLKGLKELIVDEANKTIDALLDSMAASYASALSKQELQGLLDFFGSKIGKRCMAAELKLEPELIASRIEWYQTVLQNAEKRYQGEYLERKTKEGINAKDYIPPLNIGR